MSKSDPGLHPEEESRDVSMHYSSINSSAESTIVLIHGACCSGSNWNLVTPHLSSSYHLLIPDLPGHGQSRHITPFSVEYSSRLIAQLIRKHAINGIAHVVGHSLGAHIAINLAGSYPELVNTVFVSGFEIYPPTAFSNFAPYAIWLDERAQRLVPKPLISWLMDGTDIQGAETTLDLCRQIAPAMVTTTWPSTWPARTLIVAAGKGGIIPSVDHPHDAVKLMQIGRQSNPDTVAFRHPLMRHPWNRQDPVLFAETIQTWIEGKEIPAGFERL